MIYFEKSDAELAFEKEFESMKNNFYARKTELEHDMAVMSSQFEQKKAEVEARLAEAEANWQPHNPSRIEEENEVDQEFARIMERVEAVQLDPSIQAEVNFGLRVLLEQMERDSLQMLNAVDHLAI